MRSYQKLDVNEASKKGRGEERTTIAEAHLLTFIMKSATLVNTSDVTLGSSRLVPRTTVIRPDCSFEKLLSINVVVRQSVLLDNYRPFQTC